MIEPVTPAAPHSPQRPRPRKRRHRSRGQWQSLLDSFYRSGLTKVAFCKQHHVSTSSLDRWQRMLESQPPSESGGFIDVTEPLARASTAAITSRDHDDTWQVELALGNDMVLRIRTA